MQHDAGAGQALMRRPNRNAHPDTTAVDPKYEETITIHDREFQKFSVDHTIHLVPIDDVVQPLVTPVTFAYT